MITALLSFLGSSVFRFVLEWAFRYMDKRQDAAHERETMRLQMELAERRAQLQLEQTRLDGDIRIGVAELEALIAAQRAESTPSGNIWMDAYRSSVRPTIAYVLLIAYLWHRIAVGGGWTEFDQALVSSVFGFYFADRAIARRGRV